MKASHSKAVVVTKIINGKSIVYPYTKDAAIKFETNNTNIKKRI